MGTLTSRSFLTLALVSTCACGVPVGRALPSHRVDAPVWLTTDILEEAHRVRITVRTREPRDAQAVAMRIINQRRAQNWQVIEVAVLDEGGTPVELFASVSPHPADSLRGE